LIAPESAALPPRYVCRPPRRERPSPCCCLALQDPPELPDAATYSQEEQFALGIEPSWDSPDIATNSLPSWTLLPEAQVLVRNLSPKVAAVDAAIHVAVSVFGIGTARSQLATQVISLAPLQATQLLFPLSQALLHGDQSIGFHVEIELAVDQRLINNRGSQTISGFLTSESGRVFNLQFPLRNPQNAPQRITLAALANDLGAVVTPTSRDFAAWEQVMATVAFRIPSTLHGPPDASVLRGVTVVGRGEDGNLIDGLTYLVGVDN
jgi:hypothetical protein